MVALLLHALFAWVVWRAMLPPTLKPPTDTPSLVVLHMRLISDASPAAAAAPPPVALPAAPKRPQPQSPIARPTKPPVIQRGPPAKQAMTMQLPASHPPPLYNKDGDVRLPASATSAAKPGYVSHALQGDTRIMRHDSPIKYKATRFDQYFPPPDETAGGAVVRHVVSAIIKTKAVRLPGGIHLKCKTLLGIPTPICGDPPAPPSAKDGDERLSMAPAKLAGDPHAPGHPSVNACIAMYRAGKPLADGCPVDTPARSVDADKRAQARKHWGGQ